MLAAQRTPPRLLIRDATLDDSPRLLAVCNANAHIGILELDLRRPASEPANVGG